MVIKSPNWPNYVFHLFRNVQHQLFTTDRWECVRRSCLLQESFWRSKWENVFCNAASFKIPGYTKISRIYYCPFQTPQRASMMFQALFWDIHLITLKVNPASLLSSTLFLYKYIKCDLCNKRHVQVLQQTSQMFFKYQCILFLVAEEQPEEGAYWTIQYEGSSGQEPTLTHHTCNV